MHDGESGTRPEMRIPLLPKDRVRMAYLHSPDSRNLFLFFVLVGMRRLCATGSD